MKTSKLFMLALVVLFPCVLLASPGVTAPTGADVRALLEVNGAVDLGEQIGALTSQQIIAVLRQSTPNLPARADGVIQDVVTNYLREQVLKDNLTDKLIPIYTKNFTKADIQQLIAFYQSPIGKKLVSSMPAITADSARIGQEWAAAILPGLQTRLIERLKSEKLL